MRQLRGYLKAGLFSFKNFHFISLTASLGFEAKKCVAFVIAVYPENRNTDIAVFRIAAITCGMAPHLTGETSSLNTTSRTQCTLFSIVQWSTADSE